MSTRVQFLPDLEINLVTRPRAEVVSARGKQGEAIMFVSWFKRLAGKWFGRGQGSGRHPQRRTRRPRQAMQVELGHLEGHYAPALLDALRQLKELYLGIQVTDAGLKELAVLEQLRSLSLSGIKARCGRLKELAAFKHGRRPQAAGGVPGPDAGARLARPEVQPAGAPTTYVIPRSTVETWRSPARRARAHRMA